jgi:hypothetical protein
MITAMAVIYNKRVSCSKGIFRSANSTAKILLRKHNIPLIYCHAIVTHQTLFFSRFWRNTFPCERLNLLAPALVTGRGGLSSALLASGRKTISHSLFFIKIFAQLGDAAHYASFFHGRLLKE